MNVETMLAPAETPAPAPVPARATLALFVVLCSIVSGLMLTEQISNNVLPLTLSRFTPDARLIGLVLALNPFFGLVVQPLIGVISDRLWTPLGRRGMFLVAGAPLVALCLALIPHAGSLWRVVALVVVYQFFQDVLYGSEHPLIADLVPPPQRTLVRACTSMSTQLVSFLFLKFGMGDGVERFGEPSLYYIAAAAQLLLVAAVAPFLRETRLPPTTRPRLTARRYIDDLFGDPVLRRFALLAFVHSMFLNVITGFVVLFAVHTVRLKNSEFGDIWSLQSLLALACAIPLGLLAERWPKPRMLVVGYALAMVACALGLFADGPRTFFAIAVIFGLGAVMLDVTLKPFFTEFIPRDIIGQVTGAYNICFAIGRSLALVGGGWLVSLLDTNYRVIWLLAIGFGVVSAAIAATIPDVRYAQRQADARTSLPPFPTN